MAKQRYKETNLSSKVLDIIDRANALFDNPEYAGVSLTVRQIYYAFIANDWLPDSWMDKAGTKNNLKNYKRLADILDKGRLGGYIDWDAIQDRGRWLRALPFWATAADVIAAAARGYREDVWADQPNRIEVWVEKEAGLGTIEDVCNKWRVPYLACKGYFSQSEMRAAGLRLMEYQEGTNLGRTASAKFSGQSPHIIHIGDHDPSGLDMTRDIQDRLDMFSYPGCVTIHRVALNFDQVRLYNPPPNPVKLTDCRSPKYEAEHGDECWELDALVPSVLKKIIEDKIKELRKPGPWKDSMQREEEAREGLEKISENYEQVNEFVKNLGDGQEE